MIFFSIRVSGDGVELVGGKMNVLSRLRWLSHLLLFMEKGGTLLSLPCQLHPGRVCPLLADFTTVSDNVSLSMWDFGFFLLVGQKDIQKDFLSFVIYYCQIRFFFKNPQDL